MNRGPASNRTRTDHMARARDAWGDLPEWVAVLAADCNRTSQGRVARSLDYSAATVSQVLSNTYRGDMERVEQMVRGKLMAETITCPVLGDMTRDACLGWQKKPLAASSSHRVQMYRACRSGCPNSRLEGDQ